MTAPIEVTVDDPVTCKITLDGVRAYLSARGWTTIAKKEGHERWDRDRAWVWIRVDGVRNDIWAESAVRRIALFEGRSPAAVLREIAGEAEDAAALIASDLADVGIAFEDLSGQAPRRIDPRKMRVHGSRETMTRTAAILAGAREAEERPTRAELLAAVEEARAALRDADEWGGRTMASREPPGFGALFSSLERANGALARVTAGQPPAKTPVEVRADEIEAEHGPTMAFVDALHGADVAAQVDGNQVDAAAWLLVAQRLLAREAAR